MRSRAERDRYSLRVLLSLCFTNPAMLLPTRTVCEHREEYRRWEDNVKRDLKEIGVDVKS